jgi:hypothetical protein
MARSAPRVSAFLLARTLPSFSSPGTSDFPPSNTRCPSELLPVSVPIVLGSPRSAVPPVVYRWRLAVFGTLSETYRTCGQAGCHCQGDGPKHGPHLNVSYRGAKGKTTGYYVPKAAQEATREGVAAWQKMQECLRELAELNKERNLRRARKAE